MSQFDKTKKIRTRYAPSPTGFFHIGGLRSALFAFLIANHYKKLGYDSCYVFRIEDTDRERHEDKGILAQTKGQEWCGITPDFSEQDWWTSKVQQQIGPFGLPISYQQSTKFEWIHSLAEELVKIGKAYYDYHTSEELEAIREKKEKNNEPPRFHLTDSEIEEHYKWARENGRTEGVIRLKMNDSRVFKWNDMIRGKMEVPSNSLTDPVLSRPNHIPLYNMAVVVDDYIMEISHITRGEEHLSNTPYQIAIREAVEELLLKQNYKKVDQPIYGHLPIVIGKDGKKLSKRDKTLRQFVIGENNDDYISLGYYPKAITNFVALLGWTSKDNKEIMTMDELIERFDGSRIVKAPAFFDVEKMNWISKQYFQKMTNEDFLAFVKPFITINLSFTSNPDVAILAFKKQIVCASELNTLIHDNFINIDHTHDEEIIQTNNLDSELSKLVQISFKHHYKDFNPFTNNANEIIEKVKQETKTTGKQLFLPIRLFLIGKEHGVEMDKILPIMYKKFNEM